MPLAFDSESHGRIAFGFFNIESDMLLLENRFFFADEFCRAVAELAGSDPSAAFETSWPGWIIERSEDVGDLMGAIHGVRFTGFIGETYRRHPFPAAEEDFKQNPEGQGTQAEFREMISRYGELDEVRLEAAADVTVAGCRFTPKVFRELVHYVWSGGYPRWRDERRPDFVLRMLGEVEGACHPLFAGIAW